MATRNPIARALTNQRMRSLKPSNIRRARRNVRKGKGASMGGE